MSRSLPRLTLASDLPDAVATARPATSLAGARLRAAAREAGIVLSGTLVIALVGQLRLPLPLTPVPVTLGTLAVLGVGASAGPRRGAASALALAALAALGAPVLAGWQGGVTATFGYVLGYVPAAVLAGRAACAGRAVCTVSDGRRSVRGALRVLALMLAASAVVYVPGVLWLAAWTGVGLGQAVGLGAVPFLVGDVLKSVLVAVPAAVARTPWRRR